MIPEFYSGKIIFVTGATGFLGRSLVEKLLRSCDGIQTIYILVRHKKSKTAIERAKHYTSNPIFEFNGIKKRGVCGKIQPIFGDVLLPNLGISSEDRQTLMERVNIVFHLAATVKLNASLRYSVERNLKPIQTLIELCLRMKRLDSLVYVSTIAVLNGTNNDAEVVQEQMAISPESVIKSCDSCSDQELDELCKTHFNQYNNTYCISKALAEQLFLRESTRLNIAIVRPSAILPAYSEPVPGWVQGLQIISFGMLIGLGVLQVLPFLTNGAQCFIPVDFVVNAIISSAWSVSNQKKLQVFNLTTQTGFSLGIKDLLDRIKENSIIYPSKRVIRPPHLIFTTKDHEFKIYNIFKHWIFAYFIDLVLKLIGQKPRLVSLIQAMNDNFVGMQIFINTSPEFQLKNTFGLIGQMSKTDRKEFCFNIKTIDWNSYPKTIWLGIRRHLLKENDQSIGLAKKSYERLIFRTYVLNTILLIIPIILLLVYGYYL